jgi:hypothetical protein
LFGTRYNRLSLANVNQSLDQASTVRVEADSTIQCAARPAVH